MIAVTILAGACILIGSTGAGAVVANNLRRRPEDLGRLAAALGHLETEIGYLAAPLPEALQRVARTSAGPARALLQGAAERLCAGDGATAAEAWLAAVAAADPSAAWTAADRQALLDFGAALGASGREDQLHHLAHCRERLLALQVEARREADRSARIWLYLGALGGLGLLIICM
ncbi:MAG TPA: stage III sporulation protein AB [Bacillota bacterium]|nr:stage III sporulation protein AB [Bacillota bacterium]